MATMSKLCDGKALCTWEYYRNRDGHKVKGLTPHYMAGALSGKACAEYFVNNGKTNSANYCIGPDGDLWCNVYEENGPWTSSSYSNDCTHITVELANMPSGEIYPKALEKFKQLATDIALRYGIKAYEYTGRAGANWTVHRMFAGTSCPGDWFMNHQEAIIDDINARIKSGSIYGVKNGFYTENGHVYYYIDGKKQKGWQTVKKKRYYFDNDGIMLTGWLKQNGGTYRLKKNSGIMCTGWRTIGGKVYYFRKASGSRYGQRLEDCTKRIGGEKRTFDKKGVCKNPPEFKYPTSVPFYAKVLVDDLQIRAGAGTGYKVNGICPRSTFTITKRSGDWGKLKSGAGWIYLGNPDWVKTSKNII